jgi:hypothetical protein
MPKRVKKEEEVVAHQEQPEDDTMRIVRKYKERVNSPISAIRSHCVECCGGAVRSIESCPATDCSLWPLRMGVNVFDARHKRAKDKQ